MSINKDKEAKLSQSKIKELFSYDKDTGLFTRVKGRKGVKAGSIAGCINKSTGYRIISIAATPYRAHRLAFLYVTGEWPVEQVDHINGDRTDNRWVNLREANQSENLKNQGVRSDNTSGFVGVTWSKANSKWCAQIKANGKAMNLGYFTHKTEAIAARQAANLKYGYHPNHGRSP